MQFTKAGGDAEGKLGRARKKESSSQELANRAESTAPFVGAARGFRRIDIWRFVATLVLSATGVWAYWPAIKELVETWTRVPDYSHGFLVAPLSLYFLWARRSQFPNTSPSGLILGCSLLVVSFAMRYFGARYFMSFLDAWSILLWIAAMVAVLGGRPLLVWCLPSIVFLWFMVPLPFSLETALSLPLQRIATKISCWTLQLLGQPAFSEGNVIVIDEQQLEVAQACSGLRLFVGVTAVAYVYFVLIRRSWWEKLCVVAAVIPIAIVSNATRIVLTGLLIQFWQWSGSHQGAHDTSGYIMILFAAFLFWFLLWYLGKLFPIEAIREMPSLVVPTARRSP